MRVLIERFNGRVATKRRPPPASRTRGRNTRVEPVVAPRSGFALRATSGYGFQFHLNMPVLLVGLGTLGSTITSRIIRMLDRELGRIPDSVAYLMIDGQGPTAVMDREHHISCGTHGGIDGNGTDPNAGRENFLRHYPTIRGGVLERLRRLSSDDPQAPADKPANKALGAWVFGGCGGSSGGFQDPCEMLLLDVARSLRIATLRTNVVTMSPDMSINDSTRTVSQTQRMTVQDTAALNLTRQVGNHMRTDTVIEHPPGQARLAVRACDRAWSVTVIDQSNGSWTFQDCSDFAHMVARSYFLRILTHAGRDVDARVRDLEQLGDRGRGML